MRLGEILRHFKLRENGWNDRIELYCDVYPDEQSKIVEYVDVEMITHIHNILKHTEQKHLVKLEGPENEILVRY